MRPPIPQRIAPLTWRRPAFIWTPLGLALAVGWPAALFLNDPGPQRLALAGGAIVFAVALTSLGASWAMGRAPRTRRAVLAHVLAVSALAALAAPFAATQLLAGETLSMSMALAMAPLALLLGLPIALISGLVFAWVALARGRIGEGDLLDFRSDVQPFR